MNTFTRILQLTNLVIVLMLFVGLFAIAGLGLFALSPISYEDYVAYKSETDTVGTASRVAGVTTTNSSPSSIVAENLLDGKSFSYNYSQANKGFKLEVDNYQQGINLQKKFAVIRLSNKYAVAKNIALKLTYSVDSNVRLGLVSDNLVDLTETSERSYQLFLEPGETATLSILASDQENGFNGSRFNLSLEGSYSDKSETGTQPTLLP